MNHPSPSHPDPADLTSLIGTSQVRAALPEAGECERRVRRECGRRVRRELRGGGIGRGLGLGGGLRRDRRRGAGLILVSSLMLVWSQRRRRPAIEAPEVVPLPTDGDALQPASGSRNR